MSTAPRLSIIIATRNVGHVLERCLASIIGQEFSEWELLIKDGDSTDGTVDIIRSHETHISWWRSGADTGIYDAWNQALAHARGEYVCFLGADDMYADDAALSRLFAKIGERRYDLVTSRGRIIYGSKRKMVVIGGAWDYRRLGRRIVVCHPGLLHRRDVFDRLGNFDCRYRVGGDMEFLLRVPPDATTLHVDAITVAIDGGGISRTNVLARLREQRDILARCQRYGVLRAYIVWLDKLWRYPIARVLNIPY